ncbi:hypothetical protein GTU73_04730 [Rathayibacter sp. VKM Ac-2804]|uniref:hypothetical protein n=1 Tax=Rathayibacter sp. VKM Ac-2804 TaxID=2609257 RepID=UPI00132E8B33|nr:hypothetical protein [Rathayibacter sp. VKM Ac-2804]QHF23380.1 hypothetical protein GTU73_04730 [Rathayibacter sp. VKM Ac-2804]
MTAALALGAAPIASAFPIYEDADFRGYAYQATWVEKDGLGSINRKASSLKTPNRKTLYENRGMVGRSIRLQGDVSALSSLTSGLNWLETWNDRIQSYN